MLCGDGDALIVVDVQNDFCPGGALAVTGGDGVVPVLNDWVEMFTKRDLPIVYTQDWHPEGHISFEDQGGPWPEHCVQGTHGAAFHPELRVQGTVFRKGYRRDRDAYSGFEGSPLRVDESLNDTTGLATWLTRRGVKRVLIGGLATDVCVRATVLDALKHGFETVVVERGCSGVAANPGDVERALAEMAEAGATVV